MIRASIAILLLAGPAAWAWQLPAGKGLDAMKKSCIQCHEIEAVQALHHTRADWNTLVISMREMGADVSDADTVVIVDYLTLHFGPAKVSPGEKPASPNPRVKQPLKPVPWEKKSLSVGQALYRENCVVCHDVNQEESKKLGPSFYRVFQRPKMPKSDNQPSRAYIAARIRLGGPIMPAFAKKLSAEQIERVIDFLATK